MLAARECLGCAGLENRFLEDTALVSATTVGGMDKTEQDYPTLNVRNAFINTHPCGDSTDGIAGYLGLSSYRTTLSTACSSGANAMIHAARLISSGRAQRVLAGGTDALSRFTLNGFNSLMILDPDLCRPFDRDRKGLNLGEGAAYLLLESEASASDRGARVLGRLSGFANTNDAYHQTASSPGGEAAYAAMSRALAMAGLQGRQVSYINAHGTGTENNDASEGRALQRLFGDALPPFSSTKAFTGHTLGAAAGLEAVFSMLSIMHGIIYPSKGFERAMDDPALVPETLFSEGREIAHVLSNSFGFGGNNTTLIFSKS
jgi:3-oxoacyl-[acyl-carrier-protein] synthase-1